MRRSAIAVFASVTCTGAAFAQVAADPGPAGLPDQFVAAWNDHDSAAFALLYTEDAVWVPVAEERTQGREAIVGEFSKIHVDGWAARTTIALKEQPELHLLTPDVATLFFHMDFLQPDGQPVAGLQRALILVAVRSGGNWKIAAGQLTKQSDPD